MSNIILASKSPRRRELIEKIGIINYKIVEPDVDESTLEGANPWQTACYLAFKKARDVAARFPGDNIIIAADTIVSIDGNTLGKPSDETEAFAMLNLMSGIWHEVVTGIVVRRETQELVEYESTAVKFRELTIREIEGYIATGSPMDKAGGYGVQDMAALFVERIEGDYYNVMGLPLHRLGLMLREVGIELF
ncbi:MAG: septum formation protein Maf [Clostridiales bacterium]|jgi:septum formation protein|nr:septum formation protein Maf [Clostridiales bacterium]